MLLVVLLPPLYYALVKIHVVIVVLELWEIINIRDSRGKHADDLLIGGKLYCTNALGDVHLCHVTQYSYVTKGRSSVRKVFVLSDGVHHGNTA